ncbi:MAG: integration host factor subunit beta [Planctomycetota bacterium]|nr:integration host factor subunit beta [Planctomycetota bacterium]
MNKAELIDEVQKSLGADCSKAHAERVVQAVLSSVGKGLREHGSVQLVGFGTFQVKERAARMGRNPRTGEAVHVGEKYLPFFKTGKELRVRLNGKDG